MNAPDRPLTSRCDLSNHAQTTSNPSRFLLSDHLFSTAASLPLFRLARPFGAEDKGKGKQREEEETFDEGEQEDVLFVSELPGVDKWLKRVCDVKG